MSTQRYDSTTLAGMVGQQLETLRGFVTVVSSDGPAGLALMDDRGRRVDISASVDIVRTLAPIPIPRPKTGARLLLAWDFCFPLGPSAAASASFSPSLVGRDFDGVSRRVCYLHRSRAVGCMGSDGRQRRDAHPRGYALAPRDV